MVGEDISIQHEDNLVNIEIEEGYEENYDVNKGEIIDDYEQGMIYSYVTEEDESDEDEKTTKD